MTYQVSCKSSTQTTNGVPVCVAAILRCISRLELIKPSTTTWSCRWERGSAHAWYGLLYERGSGF